MQVSLSSLDRQAIDAALKADWKQAVELNLQILAKDPKDLDAKTRLGRAYIQLSEFNKAKKIFKEILQIDPINQIALKNYKLASEKKTERRNTTSVDPKSLLKEPGTTAEVKVQITAKRILADDFAPGETLLLKIEKRSITVLKTRKEERIPIGTFDGELLGKLNIAKSQGANISAHFVNGNGKEVKIMLKSTIPVFKAEKQEIRPYIKKGSIDEPELELPEIEE